jgi:hypothetical protein
MKLRMDRRNGDDDISELAFKNTVLGVTMPRKPIRDFDLNAFSGPFRAESDRACAVLGAALLDARLESLFQRRLRHFSDKLLSHSGPLGPFSARIQVARALAWISDDVHFDLDQIRKIRNVFAHEVDHELSFANQSIADKCRTLKTAQTLIDANDYSASKPHPNFSREVILAMGSVFKSPRQRYEVSVEMLAQHIDELSPETSDYTGPNLKQELWDLGSTYKISIKMVGTVGPLPPSTPQN